MTQITSQDGKIVFRDGKVGTQQACCCKKCSGPCDPEIPCPTGCTCWEDECVDCSCIDWDTSGWQSANEFGCTRYIRTGLGQGCGSDLSQTQRLFPKCNNVNQIFFGVTWKAGYPAAFGTKLWAVVLDFSQACCFTTPCAGWVRVRVLVFDCETSAVTDETSASLNGATERTTGGTCFPPLVFQCPPNVATPEFTIGDPEVFNACNPLP